MAKLGVTLYGPESMSVAAHLSIDPDRPVDAQRMLRTVAIKPVKSRPWQADGAAIGVGDGCRFATGPGGCAALFDGQIHNRGDLVALVGGGEAARYDDARLVIAVYQRCGDDTPDRVIGDYALAIWDAPRRRALLAVDPAGLRTLVVHERPGELLIASEAAGLFATGAVERRLDETRVAEWLALLSPAAIDRSFFVGVRRVPPGGRGVWEDGRLRIDHWWNPLARPMLHLPSHADYAAALHDALDEAVACRLDPDTAIGSHLSGGLDSATVTALAARRLGGAGRRLTAFTAVPAHPFVEERGRFGNEWPHAAAVAALYPNIDHLPASNDAIPIVDMLDLCEPTQDVPLFNVNNSVWNVAIDRAARDRGIGVMLTGSCGNMTFSYDGSMLMRSLVRQRRVGRVAREAYGVARAPGGSVVKMAAQLADGILPATWTARLRALTGRRAATPDDYSLIAPDFAARQGVAERLHAQDSDLRIAHPDDSRAVRLGVLRRNDVQGDFANGARRRFGVDTRDPTMDRRVVELCLSIPDDQYQHRGYPRAIARTLARDLLPPVVRDDRRKGLQGADWIHTARADLPRLKADVARLKAGRSVPGWVDLDRIDRALTAIEEGTSIGVGEWTAVSRALAAARFVRRIEGGNQ